MLPLLYSLLALCLVAFVAGRVRAAALRRKLRRGEIDELPPVKRPRPDGCCGKHEVCEKELLLAAAAEQPEYYDDEELDAFRGRPSGSYSPAEVEAFEEVMTTMRPDEVAGWLRSLQLRGVELPDSLKDEAMLLMEG